MPIIGQISNMISSTVLNGIITWISDYVKIPIDVIIKHILKINKVNMINDVISDPQWHHILNFRYEKKNFL